MIKKMTSLIFAVFVLASAQCLAVTTLKMNTQNAPGSPIQMACVKFADLVEKKSAGNIRVNVFHSGVLGSDQSILAYLRGGVLDIGVMNTGFIVDSKKEFAVIDMPFMFNNERQADAFYAGKVGQVLAEKAQETGVVNLDYWELGFRHITNSKRPINSVDDLKGLKFRVVPNPPYIDAFAALGANPVTMVFNEVFTALEMHVVDGQDNPLSVIDKARLFEVQKYLTITGHVYTPQSVFMSAKTWAKLSQQERKIVTEAALEAGIYERKLSRSMDAELLADLKKKMIVNELSASEVQKMRVKLQPMWEKYRNQIGVEFANLVESELARVSKK